MARPKISVGKILKFTTLCLVLLVVGTSLYTEFTSAAPTNLTNKGPNDGDFLDQGSGNPAPMFYQLSNTVDVVATTLSIPIYVPGVACSSSQSPTGYCPAFDAYIQTTCMPRGINGKQDGGATVNIGTNIQNPTSGQPYVSGAQPNQTICNSNDSYTPPVYKVGIGRFTCNIPVPGDFWSNGSPYACQATVAVGLPQGANGFRSFQFLMVNSVGNPAANMLIGYSTKGNTDHFAIANKNRCDKDTSGNWIDQSGCSHWYNYSLRFAPACDIAAQTGTASINIFDPDDGQRNPDINTDVQYNKTYGITLTSKLRGTSGAEQNQSWTSQPTKSDLTANNKGVTFSFNYDVKKVYTLHLNGVYSNNVIQFKLPFDSVYHDIDCNWTLDGTTQMYSVSSTDGSCDTTHPHSDGWQITAVGQKVCFQNYVTNRLGSTMTSGDFDFGVRYMTIYGGSWHPAEPPESPTGTPGTGISRPANSNPSNPGVGCAWPNTDTTIQPSIAGTGSSGAPAPYPAGCNNANDNHSPGIGVGKSTTQKLYNYVTIPTGTPVGTVFCEYIHFTPDNDAGATGAYSKRQCLTIKAQNAGPPQCLQDSNSPDARNDRENGIPFTFNVPVIDHLSSYPDPSTHLYVTITPVSPATASISPAGSNVVGTGSTAAGYVSPQFTATSGTYNYSYKLATGPLAAGIGGNCTGSFNVGNKPFFNVVGGDVSSGAEFGKVTDLCRLSGTTDGRNIGIKSWNNDGVTPPGFSPRLYYGAGSQMAAFAGGDILSFITGAKTDSTGRSGVLINGAAPNAISGTSVLAFANSSVGATWMGNYGGNFVNMPCQRDFVQEFEDNGIQTATPALNAFSSTLLINGAPGFINYQNSGVYNVTIDSTYQNASNGGNPYVIVDTNGVCLPKGTHITIYVNADVFLRSNVQYATSDSSCPGYGGPLSISDIPSFTVLSTGGIYVGQGVTLLRGTYVAQNGPFATCSASVSQTLNEKTVYSTCSTHLDVYGSVLANSVDLDRSHGSLNVGYGTDPTPQAETFHYTPEEWLPSTATCTQVADCPKYDAITGLPPVL